MIIDELRKLRKRVKKLEQQMEKHKAQSKWNGYVDSEKKPPEHWEAHKSFK